MVDALVTYDKGLDRWYGMLELAEEAFSLKSLHVLSCQMDQKCLVNKFCNNLKNILQKMS